MNCWQDEQEVVPKLEVGTVTLKFDLCKTTESKIKNNRPTTSISTKSTLPLSTTRAPLEWA